jgi:hypothetical protein
VYPGKGKGVPVAEREEDSYKEHAESGRRKEGQGKGEGNGRPLPLFALMSADGKALLLEGLLFYLSDKFSAVPLPVSKTLVVPEKAEIRSLSGTFLPDRGFAAPYMLV